MAKARSKLADLLTGWSKDLFNWLTRHEDHSEFVRRIKLPLLGLLVILIGWISTGSICINMCYAPLELQPCISEASATPNPTAGADSIEVKAHVYFEDSRAENEEIYIDSAACYILGDADTVQMKPDDGEFGGPGTPEDLTGKIFVGDMEPSSLFRVWTTC